MGAFQGRALKLETARKVTFPLKCHVFLEKSFVRLKKAFCPRAVRALLPTELLEQELLVEHPGTQQTKKGQEEKSLGSTFPSGRFAPLPLSTEGRKKKKKVQQFLGSPGF